MHSRESDERTLLDGRLAPCPDRPNCVCTDFEESARGLVPIPFQCPAAAAISAILSVIEAQPRARLRSSASGYLHIEFSSRMMRYVDDVEFRIDSSEQLIHFRSASRTGYWDLGANTRRMRMLRKLIVKRLEPSSNR